MAKYYVVHQCGHEITHQITGPQSGRNQKVKWLEENICSECYRDVAAARREQENREAARANQGAGLCELDGTEKQIAWAESIRKEILDEYDDVDFLAYAGTPLESQKGMQTPDGHPCPPRDCIVIFKVDNRTKHRP